MVTTMDFSNILLLATISESATQKRVLKLEKLLIIVIIFFLKILYFDLYVLILYAPAIETISCGPPNPPIFKEILGT